MTTMEMIQVKAKKEDGQLAFSEQHEAHPSGQATVRGDGKAVTVAKTALVEKAIADGLIQLAPPDDAVSTTTETVETETDEEDAVGF